MTATLRASFIANMLPFATGTVGQAERQTFIAYMFASPLAVLWAKQPDASDNWIEQANAAGNWATQADAVSGWTSIPDAAAGWTEQPNDATIWTKVS